MAVAALLAGCAGYHLGPVNGAVAGEKSIEVLPFNNQTLQPRLGDAVTQALRERLQTDGTYHLATHGPGDVVVSGVITRYNREGLSYLNNDVTTTENYRVGIIAHVIARDRNTGKVLLDKNVNGYTLDSRRHGSGGLGTPVTAAAFGRPGAKYHRIADRRGVVTGGCIGCNPSGIGCATFITILTNLLACKHQLYLSLCV